MKEHSAKESIARRFDRVAATYGRVGPRFFAHFGCRLVELAQISGGADVLDVATGRGAILYPAAGRVGPRGRVVGIDLSAHMVRETAAEAERLGLRNVSVYRMDAERLTLPDASFDAVMCGLSIFFFPHPRLALREMNRVLRPGGRVGITTFARDSEHLRWAVELLDAYRSAPETQVDKGGKDSSSPELDTPFGLAAALSGAGFEEVQVIKEEANFAYQDEEEVWASIRGQAADSVLQKMVQTTRERLKADVFSSVQVFRRPDGIYPPPFRILFALGTKPAHLEEPGER
jgi:ubiquinone/menaquinone biosynthesis C-methylase UbiE